MKALPVLLSLATLSVPAFAQGTNPAVGDSSYALNFAQGQATLDGQLLNSDLSRAPRQLHEGEVLATENGAADVLLAPGALLRLGGHTTVRMVGTENRAEVRIEEGRANVDVNDVRSGRLLLVDLPHGQTQMLSRGVYAFNAATETARVYSGEAEVFPGAATDTDVKPVKVKEGHEVSLDFGKPHAASFDRADSSELLPWSGPGETNAAMADGAFRMNEGYASTYGGGYGGGYGGYGGGYGGYGLGGYGFGGGYGLGFGPYASGFGYGFGDPYFGYPFGFGYPYGLGLGFYGGGYYGGGYGYGGYGYGGGYGGGGVYGRHFPTRNGALTNGGGFRGGASGLSGAGRGFSGATRGFSGGAGGFHGGGGGGGFHGGGGGGHR